MTLPKKNRRNIVVDGHAYHWQFDPFRLWGNDSFVCVQDATGRGPLLKMQWVGIALPKHIEAAIRFAKLNGWRPDGANICEIGADSNFDPVTFRMKPNGASRYWFYDDYYGVYSPRNPHNPNMLRRAADAENAE
jgi:hypothetical protein